MTFVEVPLDTWLELTPEQRKEFSYGVKCDACGSYARPLGGDPLWSCENPMCWVDGFVGLLPEESNE